MCYKRGVVKIIHLQIELLPEGVYLGTSDDVQGLVVEAKTKAEVIDIAEYFCPILLEMSGEKSTEPLILEPFEVPYVQAA